MASTDSRVPLTDVAIRANEAPMLAEWLAHVRGYAPIEARFAQ